MNPLSRPRPVPASAQADSEQCSAVAASSGKYKLPPGMLVPSFPFVTMYSHNSEQLTLKSSAIHGEVQGLLFSFTVRQEFKNEGEGWAKDVVCGFTTGWNMALLGVQVTLAERKLTGIIVKNSAAEEIPEEKDDRDAAIIFQYSPRHRANLGKIEPGETVVVELHCASLLSFEQGQVELRIPGVTGEGPGIAKLAYAQTSQEAEGNAHSPCALALTIKGDMAKADIRCPSHPAAIRKVGHGVRVTLEAAELPRRDFVLRFDGIPEASHALCMQEKGLHMQVASFAPHIPPEAASPLGVKILVDCQLNMTPPILEQVQKGMYELLDRLPPEDRVAYSSYFDDEVRHLTRELLPCNAETRKKLAAGIATTETNKSHYPLRSENLRSLCEDIVQDTDHEVPQAILWITTNHVFDEQEIITIARSTGHRIFGLGIGLGPAMTHLREIAGETGGNCEHVSEEDDIAGAIVQMFQRMRGSIAMKPRIDWGQKPLWQSRLPGYLYAGETVHAFALLEGHAASAPVLSWEVGGCEHREACRHCESTDNEDLLRLGRMWQLEEAASDAEKLVLAFRYRLVSDKSTLLLVHERQKSATRLEALSGIEHIRWCIKPDKWDGALITGITGMLPIIDSPRDPDAWRRAFATKKELLEYILHHWHKYSQWVNSVEEFHEILQCSEKGEALETFLDLLWDNSPQRYYYEYEPIFLHWAFQKLQHGKALDRYSVRLMRFIISALKNVNSASAEWLREILDEWYADA